jgi:ABC-type transporter Mla subunit MlaD
MTDDFEVNLRRFAGLLDDLEATTKTLREWFQEVMLLRAEMDDHSRRLSELEAAVSKLLGEEVG